MEVVAGGVVVAVVEEEVAIATIATMATLSPLLLLPEIFQMNALMPKSADLTFSPNSVPGCRIVAM